ncbi:MAG TPA: DUF5615 family PIN-like protein [Pyrinomonadaceae bacterium]|nr:DUF5615 family PIN-like protein [Pyrinomonadaceae bacterium]
MLRLLTDENFNQYVVRGLNRRLNLNLLSVRAVGLAGFPDPLLLNWAAQEDRVMLTHDAKTMLKFAQQLLIQEQVMAGLILVREGYPIGRAIDDLQLMIECYSQSDMHNRIEYVPL